jgi:hypothetical protein
MPAMMMGLGSQPDLVADRHGVVAMVHAALVLVMRKLGTIAG